MLTRRLQSGRSLHSGWPEGSTAGQGTIDEQAIACKVETGRLWRNRPVANHQPALTNSIPAASAPAKEWFVTHLAAGQPAPKTPARQPLDQYEMPRTARQRRRPRESRDARALSRCPEWVQMVEAAFFVGTEVNA